MYPYFYTGGSSKISTDTGNSFMNGSEFISAETVEKFSELFQLSPNAMAPGYGLAENVCLATFASQDYRVLKLDYEAYQKTARSFWTKFRKVHRSKKLSVSVNQSKI